MNVSDLHITCVRSFSNYHLQFDSSITVLVGKNAAGKTNIVETLQLLTTGMSFRRSTSVELLKHGCEKGKATVVLRSEKRKVTHSFEVDGKKRIFKVNDKPASSKTVKGVLPSIFFCPDDLRIIKDSPQMRRDELDYIGVQLHDYYADIKHSFEKSLHQRNKLLKSEDVNQDVLAAWTESYIEYAALFYKYRSALFKRLAPYISQLYYELSGGEKLTVEYKPYNLPVSDIEDQTVCKPLLRAELERRYFDEIQRKITLVGPHRDDISFLINGYDARMYGSQGQQRTLILALKIAELTLMKEMKGFYPLLLLDDVMSELDKTRRLALTNLINQGIQTVITTTHLSYFNELFLSRAQTVFIGEKVNS